MFENLELAMVGDKRVWPTLFASLNDVQRERIAEVLETIGLDWRLIESEIKSLKEVTPEQVRMVARRYLVDENLTVATLKPLPMDDAAGRAASPAGGRHGS